MTSGVGRWTHNTPPLAQAGITTDKATSTFQNIAPLSALEAARPGMGGEAAQGTITPDQLAAGELLGDPAAQRQEQTAIEVAKAPFVGGGGLGDDIEGAIGRAAPTPTAPFLGALEPRDRRAGRLEVAVVKAERGGGWGPVTAGGTGPSRRPTR